jgi:hypothetical protein
VSPSAQVEGRAEAIGRSGYVAFQMAEVTMHPGFSKLRGRRGLHLRRTDGSACREPGKSGGNARPWLESRPYGKTA